MLASNQEGLLATRRHQIAQDILVNPKIQRAGLLLCLPLWVRQLKMGVKNQGAIPNPKSTKTYDKWLWVAQCSFTKDLQEKTELLEFSLCWVLLYETYHSQFFTPSLNVWLKGSSVLVLTTSDMSIARAFELLQGLGSSWGIKSKHRARQASDANPILTKEPTTKHRSIRAHFFIGQERSNGTDSADAESIELVVLSLLWVMHIKCTSRRRPGLGNAGPDWEAVRQWTARHWSLLCREHERSPLKE